MAVIQRKVNSLIREVVNIQVSVSFYKSQRNIYAVHARKGIFIYKRILFLHKGNI